MAHILEECLQDSSRDVEDPITSLLKECREEKKATEKKTTTVYNMKSGKKRARKRCSKKPCTKTQKTSTNQISCDVTSTDLQLDSESIPDDGLSDLYVLNNDGDSEPQTSNWFKRTSSAESSWVDVRQELINSLIKREYFTSDLCLHCGINPSCIECYGCLPTKNLCFECDRKLHVTHPFHDRTIFNECLIALAPTQTFLDGEIMNIGKIVPLNFPKCNCGNGRTDISVSTELVAVIRTNGRFDLNKFVIKCSCGNSYDPFSLTNLVESGYWPGSLKQINYIFHESCFVMWDRFSKRMPGSSVSSYVKSLEDISRLNSRTDVISCTLFTRTYREWKYGQHELEKLMKIPIFSCPACNGKQHSCHVDGNSKLYRYKTSGKRNGDSYYKDLFISSNEIVNNHLESLDYSKQKSKKLQKVTCGPSILKAAQDISRRKAALDETGLEYCVCRHGIALKAVNMFRGEIFGYAHFLQTTFMLSQNVEFFWYDVVCKYWPWLNSHDPFISDQMKPALSVMHGKIHQMSCQVQWSGRWQKGSAKSSGEEAEQVNSYLSRVGNTTKYMLPQNREDVITEFASDWNCRKIAGLAKALVKRYQKNLKDTESSMLVWENSCNGAGINTSVITMTELTSEIVTFFTAPEENVRVLSLTETCALYFLRLKQLDSDNHSDAHDVPLHYLLKCGSSQTIVQSKLKILMAKLRERNPLFDPEGDEIQGKIIRKVMDVIKEKILNHNFQATIKRLSLSKLTDTSKQRIRMRRTIDTILKKASIQCEEYNSLANMIGEEHINLNNNPLPVGGTIWEKKIIVDQFQEWQRCLEEGQLLLREMQNYVDYFTALENAMKENLKVYDESTYEDNQHRTDTIHEQYDNRGIKALYNRSKSKFTKQLDYAKYLFSAVPRDTSVQVTNIFGNDGSDSEDEIHFSDAYDSEDDVEIITDEQFFKALEQD